MGRAKEWYLEQIERGYGEAEGYICAECVIDPFLKQWVTDEAEVDSCSFCGRDAGEPIAVSMDEFVGVIVGAIRFDWNHPDNEGVSYSSAEGGYLFETTDTWDIIGDLEISEDSSVLDAIGNSIGNDGWVPRNFYTGDKSQRLGWGWDWFKHVVKHQTRFVFLAPNDDHLSEVPPSDMLSAIGETINDETADLDLVRIIPKGSNLFRIRVGKLPYKSGKEIGTPPVEFALQSNRMSPAGIAMFYGAFDIDTARAETVDPKLHAGQILSIGTFQPLRDLRVLDLSNLPDIPSLFDEGSHHRIHPLRFLYEFAHDIAKPIARDGREHVEYVPTQIATEYFRRVFRDGGGEPIDGIIYDSSRNPNGGAFVLFCENEQCFKDDDAPSFSEQLVDLVSVMHEQTDNPVNGPAFSQ